MCLLGLSEGVFLVQYARSWCGNNLNQLFRWSKTFFLIACIKKDDVLTFLILGSILDHIFVLKKDKLFCPVFVFCRGMSNAIYDVMLYLQSEGLNISWICPITIPFQYLKTIFAIQHSTLWMRWIDKWSRR